jgi:hypothetical protein
MGNRGCQESMGENAEENGLEMKRKERANPNK